MFQSGMFQAQQQHPMFQQQQPVHFQQQPQQTFHGLNLPGRSSAGSAGFGLQKPQLYQQQNVRQQTYAHDNIQKPQQVQCQTNGSGQELVSRQESLPPPPQAQPTRQSVAYTVQANTPQSGSPGVEKYGWSSAISAVKQSLHKDKDQTIFDLKQKIATLEHELRQKVATIGRLENELEKVNKHGPKKSANPRENIGNQAHRPIIDVFRKPTSFDGSGPVHRYVADPKDEIDVFLERIYNTTNSAVPFHRINKGWYRFGKTQVELSIVNSKLMAKTDEGWNRGKLGDVEKFVITFEPVERERLGIPYE